MGAALEATGLTARYGAQVVLDDVSLAVGEGECVALVGESGSGKSTLLRAFNGLTAIASGRATVGGQDVASLPAPELRRSVGYVPQDGGLLPHWTVTRNVALVPSLLGRESANVDAAAALRLVGLDDEELWTRWPHQLSGGQRQRVAVARALAAHPRATLLDEPFGALDAITRTEIQRMFVDVRRRTEVTALFVTHDMREAFVVADRVAVLHRGRLQQLASPAVLCAEPATPYVRTLLERSGVIA